jgi:phage terminase large subunit
MVIATLKQDEMYECLNLRYVILQKEQGKQQKCKVASVSFYGLQTPTRIKSVTVTEIGRLFTLWIEDCKRENSLIYIAKTF